MQADARLVEDEDRVDERSAEAGGEIDALDLAAGERARGAVEREIAEADLVEVTQAGEHAIAREVCAVAAAVGGLRGAGGIGGEQVEEFADGQRVELGQRVALPAPAKRLGLQAEAVADGAGVVGAVAGEEDPHVHLVGVLFEPAEEALHAVPVLRPLLAVFLAVAGLAVDHEGLLLGRERGKRHVGADALFLRELAQVVEAAAVHLALPALDGAVVDGAVGVGDGEAVVHLDHAAEAAAVRAGAERGVEGKQRGRGGAEGAAGARRVQAARVVAGGRERVGAEEPHLALTEVERGFHGFEETRLVFGGDGEAVLRDEQLVGGRERRGVGGEFVEPVDGERAGGVGHEYAHVGLALELRQDVGPRRVGGPGDAEGHDHGGAGVGGARLFPDGARVVVLDGLAGRGIEAAGDVAEPDFGEIGELRHRADGGAGGLDGVGLRDGDRRTDVLDGVHLGLVEQVEKLAGVGAKRLDVAPLALGVERVEDERALAGAAQPGDDDEAPQRQIEVEALQVVLAHATQADALGL